MENKYVSKRKASKDIMLQLMERIEKGEHPEDAISLLMEYYVNRAAAFNREKYPVIILDKLGEDSMSRLAYHIADIVTSTTPLELFLPASAKELGYVKENASFNFINDAAYTGLCAAMPNQGIMFWSWDRNGDEEYNAEGWVNILFDTTDDLAHFVVDTLYDEDDEVEEEEEEIESEGE